MAFRRSLLSALRYQLATIRADGRPANRTVVHRGFLGESDTLLSISDIRFATCFALFSALAVCSDAEQPTTCSCTAQRQPQQCSHPVAMRRHCLVSEAGWRVCCHSSRVERSMGLIQLLYV